MILTSIDTRYLVDFVKVSQQGKHFKKTHTRAHAHNTHTHTYKGNTYNLHKAFPSSNNLCAVLAFCIFC